jgi:hypothetical protein
MKSPVGYKEVLWCVGLLSASAGILFFSQQLTGLVVLASLKWLSPPIAWSIVMLITCAIIGAGIGALFKIKAKGALAGAIAFGLIFLTMKLAFYGH